MTDWKKTSEFSISDDRFYIAKVLSNGKDGFMLWDKERLIGFFKTADEARQEAQRIKDVKNRSTMAKP